MGCIRRTTLQTEAYDMEEQQGQLKNINRRTVLNYIRRHSVVTKADLAAATGFTFAAVKKIIDELENQKLVRFACIEKRAVGRNSVMYEINPDYGYMLSLYINRRSIHVAVVNFGRTIVSRRRLPMENRTLKQKELIEIIMQSIREVIQEAGVAEDKYIGVGIGVPGPIDMEKGLILTPPNMPVLHYLPLREIISSKLGMPVYLHKDTNALAMGEYWNGAARGDETLVYLDIDMGIGSGMIINGKINAGIDGKAGEFGHGTIDINGPQCKCGNRGCLEAMASGIAVIRDFAAELENYPAHPLYPNRDKLGIDDLAQAYENKDMIAVPIVNRAAFYVGVAVANVINFLDPEKVVLGGLFLRSFEGTFDIIVNVASQRTLKSNSALNLSRSVLGSDAAVIGCAEVVLDAFFQHTVNEVWTKN